MLGTARRLAAAAVSVALAGGLVATTPTRAHEAQPPVPHFLVFTETYGFRHDGIAEAVAVIQQLARHSGEFTVEVSRDPAQAFSAETYARVDGFILPNVTGLGGSDSPLTAQQRADFLAFVDGGGAIVGVHATADTGGGWPELDEMLGSYGFDMHPHYSLEARDNPLGRSAFNPGFLTDVVIQVEDPDHPTTDPWDAVDSFRISEEIYRWQGDPRADEHVHVVLSLDEESHYWRSEIGAGPAAGGLTPDVPNPVSNPVNHTPLAMPDDSPIAWVKRYDPSVDGTSGAVFYTNLGHNLSTWERVDFQEHLAQGIAWVAGAVS